MPIYQIGLDDGRTLHIDADDQDAALAGAQHVLKYGLPQSQDAQGPGKQTSQTSPGNPYDNLPEIPEGWQLQHPDGKSPNLPSGYVPEAPKQAPVTTSGLAKAAGAGVASGLVSLPGDIVSLINLARRGYGAVTGNGYNPAKDDYSLGAGYEGVRKAVDDIYTPQNTAESWAKTAGEYAPALIGGPESLAGKGGLDAAKILAKRAALQAAVPAMASNAAGTVADAVAPDAAPYARVGAALLAGGLGTRGTVPTTTSKAVLDAANSAYDEFRSYPVSVKPDVVQKAAQAAQAEIAQRGMDNSNAFKMLEPLANSTAPVSLNTLEQARQDLTKEAGAKGSAGTAGAVAKDHIAALFDDLSANDVASGAADLPAAISAVNRARNNAFVGNQLKTLEAAQYAADTKGTAVQDRIASLLLNKRAMNRLEQYRADLESINNNRVTNSMRTVAGAVGGHNAFLAPLMFGEALGVPTGLGTWAAMAGGASVLKRLAERASTNQVNGLRNRIAANAKGLPPRPVPAIPWPTRALIGTLGAQGNSAQQ